MGRLNKQEAELLLRWPIVQCTVYDPLINDHLDQNTLQHS